MTGRRFLRRLRSRVARLRADTSGLALLEFAFSLPMVLFLGIAGIEVANLALTNMRVSQIALNLADNASRVGERTALATQQLREIDVNDVLVAVRQQGEVLSLTERGRVTLSSLEADAAGVQRIHWQRCIGQRSGTGYDSSYGTAPIAAGTDASAANAGPVVTGMGPAGRRVTAPPRSGVMFVEINYDYRPITFAFTTQKISYTASFIVRDNRDFSQIFNPAPTATRATCNLHAA